MMDSRQLESTFIPAGTQSSITSHVSPSSIVPVTIPKDQQDEKNSVEGGNSFTISSLRGNLSIGEKGKIQELTDIDAPFSDEYFYTVSGELKKNIAFVQKFKTIQELEIELFEICKDYEVQFALRGVNLQSLKQIYHIVQLQRATGFLRHSDKQNIESDLETSLQRSPWTWRDYKWIERVFHFLNLLAMKWELINPNLYRYRNDIVPPTDPLQVHEYKMRQIWVFPIETVWFAIRCLELPLRNQLPPQVVGLAKTLEMRTLELIRRIASLNFKVNFKLHPDIREFLCVKSDEEALYHIKKKHTATTPSHMTLGVMGESVSHSDDLHDIVKAVGQQAMERSKHNKPIKPKIKNSELKLRHAKASEIGFHLLELPAVLCRCMELEMHTINVRLRSELTEYELIFRTFEFHFTRLVERRNEEKKTQERQKSEKNTSMEELPPSPQS